MNKYYIFDIVKFFLSLLVVQIHVGFIYSYNENIDFVLKNWLGRFAVPLFFMISSFLLFSKVDVNDLFSKKSLLIYRRYFFRLIRLYFICCFIYSFFLKFFFGYNITFFSFVISFFTGFYRQFWFIPSQIFGTILFLFLLKNLSFKSILFVSIFLYIVGLFLVPYNSIVSNVFNFVPHFDGNIGLCRNFLTFALLFIVLGASFSFYPKNRNGLYCFLLSVFFLILSCFEFLFLKNINCSYYAVQIFIVFFCYNFFGLLLNVRLNYNKCYELLRFYSVQIYCLHTLVYLILNKLLSSNEFFSNSVLMYFCVIFVCILISSLYLFIIKKYKKS